MKKACRLCSAEKDDEGRCPNCYMSAVKLEIKKPLNMEWKDLGFQLRAIGSCYHRLLNAGMLENAARHLAYEESKRQGKPDKALSGPNSYSVMVRERNELAAWYDKEANKKRKKARSLKRAVDKATGDKKAELQKQLTDAEKSADFMERRSSVIGAFHTQSVANAGYTIADRRFRKWRKRGPSERLPMYRKDQPIAIPGALFSIEEISTQGVTINLRLLAGHQISLAAVPVSGSAWQAMRNVNAKVSITGDMKIRYEKARRTSRKAREQDGAQKKGRWILLLSTVTPKPKRETDPNVTVAVNRGRHNLLYAVSSNGGRMSYPGSHILAFKAQMKSRRNQLRSKRGHWGKGARGHGRERYFKAEATIRRSEENFVATECQKAAAAVDRFCERWGAGTVVWEDFTKIDTEDLRYVPSFPWNKIGTSLERMCDTTGRHARTVESKYISSTCPCCKHVDSSQVKAPSAAAKDLPGESSPAAYTFHCSQCGFSRESDFIACITMLERSGADMTLWDKRFEQYLKATKEIKNGKNEGGEDFGEEAAEASAPKAANGKRKSKRRSKPADKRVRRSGRKPGKASAPRSEL